MEPPIRIGEMGSMLNSHHHGAKEASSVSISVPMIHQWRLRSPFEISVDVQSVSWLEPALLFGGVTHPVAVGSVVLALCAAA